MAFGDIDGSVHVNASTQNVVGNLTTTQNNVIVPVFICANGGPVLSVSSTALGSFTFIGRGGTNPFNEEVWAAFASGAITSDPITVHQSSAAFCTVDAFGVRDTGQTSLVFDSGGPQTGSSDPISITTVNANTAVFAGFRGNAPDPTAGSGFTQVGGSGFDFSVVETKVLSSAQTLSCTLTNGAGGTNGSIVIAIPKAAGGTAVLATPRRVFLKRHHQPFATPRQFDRNKIVGWRPALIVPRRSLILPQGFKRAA